MKTHYSALAVVTMALFASAVHAATCGASASGVVLGTYKPNQIVPVDSVGSIRVECGKSAGDPLSMNISYSIDISRGGGASYSAREMSSGNSSGNSTLRYNLYRDTLRINIWGDASGGTSNVAGTIPLPPSSSTAAATHSVYGRIFANQNAYPGSYTDSIIVTISY